MEPPPTQSTAISSMMNGSTAFWSKASYRQHQQEVGHDKPGLAAQAEQSGLAVPQVRQLPDPELHFRTVVELELLCMWNSLSLLTSRLNSLSSLPPRLDNLALLSSRWYLRSTEPERGLQTHSLTKLSRTGLQRRAELRSSSSSMRLFLYYNLPIQPGHMCPAEF